MTVEGLLVDLDGTLYDVEPCEAAGRAALFDALADRFGLRRDALEGRYLAARSRVKARLGPTGTSHSRLLYVSELAQERRERCPISELLWLERQYWEGYFAPMRLDPEARPVLERFRSRGGRVAIVTDLTLGIQLRKLALLGIEDLVDAIVASEEVPLDKPDPAIFELAARRLDVPLAACLVVGDSVERDGGASRLGLAVQLLSGEAGWATVAEHLG